MAKRQFEFELYRINLVQAEAMLFDDMNKPIKTDSDIHKILSHAIRPEFKAVYKGSKNTFEWALRDSIQYHHDRKDGGDVFGITLAKSVIETAGEIVTDTGIEDGVSESEPPLAETGHVFFYMKRHLLIVERRSAIINSRWK